MSTLLHRAIEAHGGAKRWKEIQTIEADISVGGGLWPRKGWPDVFKSEHFWAKAHEQSLRWKPFIDPAHEATYDPDYVAIYDAGGRVVKDRRHPREHFVGHGFATAWDEMHLAYFSGYAMWNYITSPFLFAEDGFECREIGPWKEGTETWQRLHVTFPDHIATHCKEQIFYFDEKNLMRRLDYAAETSNSGEIAHYMHDHREFDGIVMPTKRKTMLRNEDGTARPEPVFVAIEFFDVKFR